MLKGGLFIYSLTDFGQPSKGRCDFSVGYVIVPKHEKLKIPTQFSHFDTPTVNTYSLETTIVEKIDAILSLMELSIRMKDYYDIYYLANKFYFDGKILVEALKRLSLIVDTALLLSDLSRY